MQIHSLDIEDFYDVNYRLISIHTSLEDYKFAYLLNKELGMRLVKPPHYSDLENKEQEFSFSMYTFEDEEQCNMWYLISNKCHSFLKPSKGIGIFREEEIPISVTNYLVPEKKRTDYFIKIEGEIKEAVFSETIIKINNIKQVVTSYPLDVKTLKSKDFLIF